MCGLKLDTFSDKLNKDRIFEARKAVKRFIEEKYAAQGKQIKVDI